MDSHTVKCSLCLSQIMPHQRQVQYILLQLLQVLTLHGHHICVYHLFNYHNQQKHPHCHQCHNHHHHHHPLLHWVLPQKVMQHIKTNFQRLYQHTLKPGHFKQCRPYIHLDQFCCQHQQLNWRAPCQSIQKKFLIK